MAHPTSPYYEYMHDKTRQCDYKEDVVCVLSAVGLFLIK